MSKELRALAGDTMLHPAAIAGVLLLLVNDHVLKRVAPGIVSGKLSDVAGLLFFPLLLAGAIEVLLDRLQRFRAPSFALIAGAVLATGVVFAVVKTTGLGAEAYRVGLGALQWPFFALADALSGVPVHGIHRVAVTRDPTDLLALPSLLVPLWVGARRARVAGSDARALAAR